MTTRNLYTSTRRGSPASRKAKSGVNRGGAEGGGCFAKGTLTRGGEEDDRGNKVQEKRFGGGVGGVGKKLPCGLKETARWARA